MGCPRLSHNVDFISPEGRFRITQGQELLTRAQLAINWQDEVRSFGWLQASVTCLLMSTSTACEVEDQFGD
jgi:hypothetical protein